MLNKLVELPMYIKAIKNRELIRMPIYITERCNSQCKTCQIWAKHSTKDMSMGMIQNIVRDFPKAFYVLQGGEPLLHPEIERVLSLLEGYDYQLFSNGMLSERLQSLVIKYNIPHVAISCDGTDESYKLARGVDNYKNVAWLTSVLGKLTQLELSYIISPWNNREELLKISELCNRYNATLHIDVYDTVKYFNAVQSRKGIYKADDMIGFPKSKVLRLYNDWLEGKAKSFCHSPKYSCFITTDGMVYSCGRKMIPLGDLNEKSLSNIWHSPSTVKIQDELTHCNECWSTCYRNIDVALDMIMPKFMVERL